MKRHMKKIAVLATSLVLSSFSTADAGGCGSHGGRGGISIGFGGGGVSLGLGGGRIGHIGHPAHSLPSHRVPNYPAPSQNVHTYPASGYPHSLPPAPVYSQPAYSQPSLPPNGTYSNSGLVQQGHGVPQNSIPQNGMPQPSMAQHSNMGQQPNMGQQQNMGQQPNMGQQGGAMQSGIAQGGVQRQAGMGPSNGSMAAPSQQPSFPQTSTSNVQAPQQQSFAGAPQGNPSASQSNAGAPAAGAPQQELSALQMLASLNGDATGAAMAEIAPEAVVEAPTFGAEATPANSAMPMNSVHVGTWRVALPGNQNITLALNPDNSFQWSATKDGKSSSFQGQYRLEEGRLTLVRSNDLQQMAGSWSGEAANFTFKLDGATTSGLAFVRAE
jgi:hypothetical protein